MPDYFSSAFVLIALFASFIGLVIWAWSKKRHSTFTHASHLPLEDDEAYLEETALSVNNSSSTGSDLNKG